MKLNLNQEEIDNMNGYTEKLYYSDPFLTECKAIVISKHNKNEICLDKTVAYPEGGGQISDIGFLCFDNEKIPFYDVQKGIGRIFSVSDFPTINVDTPIYHIVQEGNCDKFSIGQEVTVKISVERRMKTTLHHSALHLALMFAIQLRPNLYNCIKGCSITEEHGRLDFSILDRFTENDLTYINENLLKIIQDSVPIVTYPHSNEKEAWFWKCQGFICPCGGTHVTNSEQIGYAVAKRKGLGKNSERLIVKVDNPKFSQDNYH
jgi:alanyl-tRNA synthetase